jgi:23S rRNA (guanosine2251-2'-O)-methyltransferase
MKKEYIYGIHAVQAILKNRPHDVLELYIQESPVGARFIAPEKFIAPDNIKKYFVNKKKMDELCPGCVHQGIIAVVVGNNIYSEQDLLDLVEARRAVPLPEPIFLLILDGVQDPHNLGAILRSAEAAGVHAVIAPKDNAVGLTPVVRKTASGAAETIPFIQVTNLARTMRMLKEHNIWLYGADSKAENNIYNTDLRGNIAIVLGAEGKGMRRLTRENCDALMSIPLYGNVSSLNVSVAAGICLFEAIRQRTRC